MGLAEDLLRVIRHTTMGFGTNMVGFCLSGGIGDAILLLPVIQKLNSLYSGVEVVVYDQNIVVIIESIGVKCHLIEDYKRLSVSEWVLMTHNLLRSRGISLAVWSSFKTDHEGLCGLFLAVEDSAKKLVEDKRRLYYENLSKAIGKTVSSLKPRDNNLDVVKFMSEEKDFFAEWKRYGIDVSHSDVFLNSPDIKNEALDKLSPYCILHDSKMATDTTFCSKSWYLDRWEALVPYLKSRNFNVIHFQSRDQSLFKGCLSSNDLLPEKRNFWDYLDFLKRSSLYIGTDSWPGHAAIVLKDNKFIILKGSVCYKWDHFSKYSTVIRKGKCQCCEYLSLEKCVFGNGQKGCMDKISINDVKEKIDLLSR